MSRLVKILNAVKSAEAKMTLTPSQQTAHRAVSDMLKRYGQCNLYGVAICGKTFLGRRIARESNALYLTSSSLPARTPVRPQGVVADNASERRSDFRSVLATAQVRNSLPLLYISRLPVEEDMPQVKLGLMPDDLDTVIANLRCLKINVPVVEPADLWEVILTAAGGSR